MMENKNKFKALINLMGEKYEREVSKSMIQIIWEMLKPFTDDQCETAFKSVLLKRSFFKDLLPDLMEELQGKQEDMAVQAWARVDETMRRVGNYDSVDFVDRRIHKVIEILGGWVYLGTLTEDEWKWKRKEFEATYRAIREDGLEYLPGVIEEHNSALGFNSPKVINISRPRERKRIT